LLIGTLSVGNIRFVDTNDCQLRHFRFLSITTAACSALCETPANKESL
jgi:hypothetical protein